LISGRWRPRPLVACYRVSARQQKRSGVGHLAQQDAARRYIEANPGNVIAELTELESGRKSSRPKIAEAFWLCRVYEAKPVIARLDRPARSAALIAKLPKLASTLSRLIFRSPTVSRFTFWPP
jgi:DNA invertase Pin-like site-specific DNA recombinase